MHFQELSDLCEKVRANVDAIHVCKCYYMSHAYREVRLSPAAIRGYSSAAIRHTSSMSPCVPDHALASCSKTGWCACLMSLALGLLTGIGLASHVCTSTNLFLLPKRRMPATFS
jgi:hypothetical protein